MAGQWPARRVDDSQADGSASAASYQLVLIPLVTVAISAWLQDERITPAFAVGALLVLVGAYVGALRRPARRPDVDARQQVRTWGEAAMPYATNLDTPARLRGLSKSRAHASSTNQLYAGRRQDPPDGGGPG